ncbi:hypothetical protein DSO57_1032889 [Entomophthora muscae]|uniref:Uncharacterized protein n=1 Tax=Entomophthora muscae TaxID=34485 RepID=A0ACC2RFD4_9FUNG|nr:hypothetical protein DSO57_1032889 [Entomophthora muscae]
MVSVAIILGFPLVYGLNHTKPLKLPSTFDPSGTISALSLDNGGIIATLGKLDYSYQNIVNGKKYFGGKGDVYSRELYFNSSDEAYTYDGATNLVRVQRINSEIQVKDLFSAPGHFLFDISVGKTGVYVSSLTQQDPNNATSAVWKFTNGNFSKLHDIPGTLHRITLSPNETSLYGIVKTSNKERSIISLPLGNSTSLPQTVVTTHDEFKSGLSSIECDNQGNLYVANYDENINVYGPDHRFKYNISTTLVLRAMVISNTSSQTLYVGGQTEASNRNESGIEYLELNPSHERLHKPTK